MKLLDKLKAIKVYFLIFFSLLNMPVFSQLGIPIKDPHIRAQQERMVFAKWGEFRPYSDYFLGVQVNPHYTMTWGWGAPSRNDSYRKGDDIRPLAVDGEQTQRNLQLKIMENNVSSQEQETDKIQKVAESQFYRHHKNLALNSDALWRLYYSKYLNDVWFYEEGDVLKDLRDKSISYEHKMFIVNYFESEILEMQSRLKTINQISQDRGDRILFFHRLLQEYENYQKNYAYQVYIFEQSENSYPILKKSKFELKSETDLNSSDSWSNQDVELMRQLIRDLE